MWLWAKAKKEIDHNWGVLTSSKSWSEGINPALTLTAMLFPRWRLRCDRHSKCLTLKTGTGELHTAQNLSPHSPWSLKATETNNAKLHAEENVLFLLCVCVWVSVRERGVQSFLPSLVAWTPALRGSTVFSCQPTRLPWKRYVCVTLMFVVII